MSLASTVIRLQKGSDELEQTRLKAMAGDPDALKTYLYWCAWRDIQGNPLIPQKDKLKVFHQLAKADMFEFELASPAAPEASHGGTA